MHKSLPIYGTEKYRTDKRERIARLKDYKVWGARTNFSYAKIFTPEPANMIDIWRVASSCDEPLLIPVVPGQPSKHKGDGTKHQP